MLRNVLMFTVSPCFMWGPFAHPYINKKSLERAQERLKNGDQSINRELVEVCRKHEDSFVFGGNSADAVSMHHVINGISIYDYAHNAIPDEAKGVPVFGYALIDQWFQEREKRSTEELAVACGWLGHQIADWYPHYARIEKGGRLSSEPEAPADEIETFSGYADSHPVFGDGFCPVVLRANTVVEHALIEFFHDLRILDKERNRLFADPYKGLAMFGHEKGNLLTTTSERFQRTNVRIPHQHLEYLEKDFDKVIFYMRVLIEAVLKVHHDMPERLVPPCNDEYLEKSIDRVVERLFELDYHKIQQLADAEIIERAGNASGGDYVKKLTRQGSALFKILHEIGNRLDDSFSRGRVLQIVNDPFRIIPIKRGRWGAKLLYLIYRAQLRNYLAKVTNGPTVEQNALLNFMVALLRKSEDPINEAIRAFKRVQRPVVSLVGAEGGDPSAEGVRNMFENGEIKVKLSPACDRGSENAERESKELDMAKLLFRIDGYDVTKRANLFWTKTPEMRENGEVLLTVGLKSEFAGVYHHIFVDIHDRSGMHAKYLDCEVRLSPGADSEGGVEAQRSGSDRPIGA